jgi:hypothetical protein
LCYAPSKLTQTVTLLTCIQKIWFESQPRQWLFWLQSSVVLLWPPGKCWDSTTY